MAQPAVRLPPHLQPRLKAAATSSSASLDALAASTPSATSRSPSCNRAGSPPPAGGRPGPSPADDASTEALIRRTLCPYAHDGGLAEPRRLDELLPPLTSRNDVDLQLYAVLAVVIKEFVYSWYGRITPDQTFAEEIVSIVAHCTRDLEQRLRRVDLVELLLDEIPALVSNHVSSQMAARDPPHPSCLSSRPREVYHALNPHPAFSPVPQPSSPESQREQERNERYYRQLLAHGALAVLLPTEDLQSPPLRILVSDVLGEMILGKGIGQKACEGWMIWEGATKLIASMKAQMEPKRTGEEIEVHARSRLEKFGLLADRSASATQHDRAAKPKRRRTSAVSALFWRTLQYCYLAFVAGRFLVSGLVSAASSSTPDRHRRQRAAAAAAVTMLASSTSADRGSTSRDGSDENDPGSQRRSRSGSPMTAAVEAPGAEMRPIQSYAVFGLVSQVLDLRWRMPWIHGLLSLIQWHLTSDGLLMGVGAKDGLIDRFLRNLLEEQLLKPSRIPALFLQLRLAIFPNNTLGPARPTPSEDEQRAIQRQAALAILSVIPRPVARRLFAVSAQTVFHSQFESGKAASSRDPSTSPSGKLSERSASSAPAAQAVDLDPEEEALVAEVEGILDLFADSYMNKHLIFGILELCFVRLLPEMGETGVRELLEERGVAV